jgi:hypothetical protein
MTDGWQFYLTSWVRTATSAHTHYYHQTSDLESGVCALPCRLSRFATSA